MKFNKMLILCFAALLVFTASLVLGTGNTAAVDAEKGSSALTFERLDVQTLLSDKLSGVEAESVVINPDERYEAFVMLEGKTLMEYAEAAGMSLKEYLGTDEGMAAEKALIREQAAAVEAIKALGLNITFKYNYTTLTNGLGIEVRYGDILKVKALNVVEKVTLAEVYNYPAAATDSEIIMNVTTAREQYGYTGEGMVIGIIDTGIDHNHDAFSVAPENPRIDKEYIAERIKDLTATKRYVLDYFGTIYDMEYYGDTLTADDVYVSEKIPYAFDYADVDTDARSLGNPHGTHVAGIAAGNDGATFTGIAPDAQLMAFKVFSDLSSGASTLDIIAALNDAYILGVDAVNLSLGSAAGLASIEDIREPYFELLRENGTEICVSAGNDYNSAYGNELSLYYPLVYNPDYGITGSPGVSGSVFTVASIESQHESSAYLMVNGNKLEWNEISSRFFYTEMYERYNFNDVELVEYVMVPNTGAPEDYNGLDVEGKIAVVQRGTLSFQEKIDNAEAAGAIACFIYDNVDGDYINMSIEGDTIPAVFLYKKDGEMLAAQENKVVEFSTEYFVFLELIMSDFSSWGATGTLELKPEITAPGGNVLSSYDVYGGESRWAYMSGTSMSAPNVAGASVVIRQFVNETFPELSAKEKSIMVYKLAMSTAQIWTDRDGNVYSPRYQGAGVLDVTAAVETKAYINVPGQEKSKIELGDDPEFTGEFVMTFEIVNITDEELTYKVDPIVLVDAWEGAFYTLTSIDVTEGCAFAYESAGDGAYNQETGIITIYANGTVALTVTLTLDEQVKNYVGYYSYYNGGGYVEGFIKILDAQTNEKVLSVPYMGFYGDFTRAANFDFTIYEEESYLNATFNALLWGYASAAGGDWAIGTYAFNTPEDIVINPDEKHLAIAPGGNGIADIAYSYMGVLRNLAYAEYEIKDAITGEIYYFEAYQGVRKSVYDYNYGLIYPDIEEFEFTSEGVRDFYDYLPNNTQLLVTFRGINEYAYVTGRDNCWRAEVSLLVTIDNEAPSLIGNELEIFESEGRVYLQADIYDNHYAMAAWPCSIVVDSYGSMSLGYDLCEYPTPVLAENTGETTIMTWDITDYLGYIENNMIAIMIFDYALNQNAFVISNVVIPELPDPDRLELNVYDVGLGIGENINILYNILPLGYGLDKVYTVEWDTSNAQVATVANGTITGVNVGNAVITLNVMFADESGNVTRLRENVNVTVLPQADEIFIDDIVIPTNGAAVLEITTPENTITKFTNITYELVNETDAEIVALYPGDPYYVYGLKAGEAALKAVAQYVSGTGEEVILEKQFNVTVTEEMATELIAPTTFYLVDEDGNELYDLVVAVGETLNFKVIPTPAFADPTITIEDALNLGAVYTYTSDVNGSSITGVAEGMSLSYIISAADPNLGMMIIIEVVSTESGGVEEPDPGEPEEPEEEFVIVDGVLIAYNGEGGDIVIPEGVVEIADEAFYGNNNINTVVFPTTLKKIGTSAFHYSYVTGLTFQSADLVIGDYAFYYSELGEIIFPETVNTLEIGNYAFALNYALSEIVLPEGTTKIGDQAFYNCSSVESLVLPDSVTYIGMAAFNRVSYDADADFLPANLEYIGDLAMNSFTFHFDELVLPANLTYIGEENFYDNMFTSIVFNDKLEHIGGYSFYYAEPETLVLPDSVTYIGDYAFVYASVVFEEGFLPQNITYIGSRAFYNCEFNFKDLVIPEGVEYVGAFAFRNGEFDTITIPSTLTTMDFGSYAMVGENPGKYIISENNPKYKVVDDAIVDTYGNYLLYQGIQDLNSVVVTIPDNIVRIAPWAFYNTELAMVIVPENVKAIGEAAFYGYVAIVYFESPVAPILECEDVDYGYMNFFLASNVYYVEGGRGYTSPAWTSQLWIIQETTYEMELDVYSVYTDGETPELDEVVEIYGYAEPWAEGFDLYKRVGNNDNIEFVLINTVERPVSSVTGLTDIISHITFGFDTVNFYEEVYYYVQGWRIVDGVKEYGRDSEIIKYVAEPKTAIALNELMAEFKAYDYTSYDEALEIIDQLNMCPVNQMAYIDMDIYDAFQTQVTVAEILNISYRFSLLKIEVAEGEEVDDYLTVDYIETVKALRAEYEGMLAAYPEYADLWYNVEYLELAEVRIEFMNYKEKSVKEIQDLLSAISTLKADYNLKIEILQDKIAALEEDAEANAEKIAQAEKDLAEAKRLVEEADATLAEAQAALEEAEKLKEEALGCASTGEGLGMVSAIVIAVLVLFGTALVIRKKEKN